METFEISLGPWMKKQRENKLMGLRETARKAGISFNTLSRMEAEAYMPRLATLRKVSVALGLDATEVAERFQEFQEHRKAATNGRSHGDSS
tara:strand:+ start:1788 stop:2060 length:273 start_codon:yes stop_codon:yes gene_type:complete